MIDLGYSMFILPFSRLKAENADIAGGKGASLGEMTQAGIPVPPGFVVLSTAFDRFIEETHLAPEISSALESVDPKEIHTIENASEKIQALIHEAPMPQGIASEIQEHFKNLDCPFVAVRSSATSEDSADAAWAGQLDTYLNTAKEDLLRNVQRCWASLFTPRAIFYRFEKELHATKISVAVVVQKMVESEVAGIAFSVHPITQDRNQMIIEAGFGLGEAVVSGQITPDSYVVEKSPFRILDKTISTQARMMVRGEEGGSVWQEIRKDEKQALTDRQVLDLARVILDIEKHYGFPCDIEWAYEKGLFYIVQSRPITTLNGGVVGEDYRIKKIYETSWDIRVKRPGFLQSKQVVLEGLCQEVPLAEGVTIFHKNNIWIKEANLYDQHMADISFSSLFPRSFEKDPLWSLAIVEHLDRMTLEKDSWMAEMATRNWTDAAKEKRIDAIERYAYLSREISKYYSVAVPLTNYCEKIIREKDEDLLRYAVQYKALDFDDMGRSLFEIKQLRDAGQKEGLDKAVKEHIAKYGWIKTNYNIVEPYTEKDVLHELNSADHLFEAMSCPAEHPLYPIVTALQVGIYARNRMKEMLQQIWFAYEKMLPALQVSLNIPREDILQLAYRELIRSIEDEKVCVSVEDTKARHEGFVAGVLDGELVIITGPIVNRLFEHFTNVKVDDLKEIKGSPASPGYVKGRVKVVHNISQIHKLEPGDVLVTSMTTPDFIVGMKKAGAVVTDEGGLSCHAAIVSRELKLPCVIGTKIATSVLKDGDLVEVDATNGVIRFVADDTIKAGGS